VTEKDDFDLYVFRISSDINQQSGLPPGIKSDTLYSISFTVGKANAILSFSNTVQKPTITKNVSGYEICFAKGLVNKETSMLSEQLKLFKPGLPAMFLISRHQEWRVKEIFECLLDESTKTDVYRNEMIRTLIHILILFSKRLATIGANLV
jgi:hypothetical protein